MAKTLILIDISGLFWASWHSTVDQEVSAAFERTMTKVARLREGHDLCAICCDAPPYWRKLISPEYKAQRDAPPATALEQFERVKQRLTADGCLLWSVKGFEADDLIASAVKHAVKDGLHVVIASGDKDLLQLVSDANNVEAVSPATEKFYRENDVIEKFGVAPPEIADLLAIVGDKSDNIPGVPGIGPKTAAKMLLEFNSLEGILRNVHEVEPERFREAIASRVESIKLARQLVTLRDDVPIEWKDIYAERKQQPLTSKVSAPVTDAEFEEDQEESAPPPKQEPRVVTPEPEPAKQNGNGKALAIRPPESWSLALEPQTSGSAWRLALALHDSRLYQSFSNPAAIFAVIMRGRALGLDATTALATFHVIEGKPSMHASLIVGLVLRSGVADYFELVKSTRDVAIWKTKRRGSENATQLDWTIDDAHLAGLVELLKDGTYRGVSKSGKPSNWDKYRRTMLRWRCATELARAVYPDVVAGLYSPDEISDGASDEEAA